jgi:hypothetical protein
MPTLVLSPRYTPDSNTLWQAAIRANWPVMRLQNHRAPDELLGQDVVLYGEALFVAVIADQLNIALLETPVDWLPNLPFAYRQRDIFVSTLREARSLTTPKFIKPAADKSFDAKVYQTGNDLPSPEWFDDGTPVLVAEPVQWELECRCFVINRSLATFSPYLRYGELIQNDAGEWVATDDERTEAIAFLEHLLSEESVRFPPGIVIDIGKIAGRGWAVIEANPAWGSGIYGNDPDKVLSVLAHSCMKMDLLPAEYQEWLIERV